MDTLTFGNKLYSLIISQIKNKVLTYNDILKQIPNIQDYVEGKCNVTLEMIYKLSEALHVPSYYLFLEDGNFCEKFDFTIEELSDMIDNNPSLRGFILGYMAEAKIRKRFRDDIRVSNIYKPDDHDRNNKCDLVLTYKGEEFTFEIKSLQTNTVRESGDEGIEYNATFQCDASDRREILLPNKQIVNTTCLKFGDFDIVAINLYAFHHKWEYAFALNEDLPCTKTSKSKKYIIPDDCLKYLIKSSIAITYPLQKPFVSDPFVLLDRIIKKRRGN